MASCDLALLMQLSEEQFLPKYSFTISLVKLKLNRFRNLPIKVALNLLHLKLRFKWSNELEKQPKYCNASYVSYLTFIYYLLSLSRLVKVSFFKHRHAWKSGVLRVLKSTWTRRYVKVDNNNYIHNQNTYIGNGYYSK